MAQKLLNRVIEVAEDGVLEIKDTVEITNRGNIHQMRERQENLEKELASVILDISTAESKLAEKAAV